MKKIVAKFPVVTYFFLALLGMIVFGALQTLLFPNLLNYALMIGQWGPAIAAIIVMIILGRTKDTKKIFRGLSLKKVKIKYMTFAILIPVICCGGSYIMFSMINSGEVISPINRSLPNYLVCFAATIFSITGEELGWRGFMLPELLKKHSTFMSSLIVGLLWGTWHFRFQSLWLAVFFIIGVIEYSFIMTWLSIKTDGSILTAVIFHSSINMSSLILIEKFLLVTNSEGSIAINELIYGIYAIAFAVPALPIAISFKKNSRKQSSQY